MLMLTTKYSINFMLSLHNEMFAQNKSQAYVGGLCFIECLNYYASLTNKQRGIKILIKVGAFKKVSFLHFHFFLREKYC